MITRKMMITACRTIAPLFSLNQPGCWAVATRGRAGIAPSLIASRVTAASTLRTENADQEGHDDHHGDRPDHADGRCITLPPETLLERLIVHEDRPGVGRRGAVESAEDQILVDNRHCGTEAQHDEDHHDWRKPRSR